MGLDFPNSPTVGQTFPSPPQSGVPLWVWDGSEWAPYYSASGGQYSAAVLNCGRFQYVSATQCQLIPFNGASIRINGLIYQIPAAGVSISSTGLVASNLYYCYAYISGGAITLEWSQTAHATDTSVANNGTEIKSGDPSRTLVGMAYCLTAATFTWTTATKAVRSWFNRPAAAMQGAQLGSSTAIGSSYGVMTGGANFVAWANESIMWTANMAYYNSVAGVILTCTCWLNGAAVGFPGVINTDGTGHVLPCANPCYSGQIASDGYWAGFIAANINANSATMYNSSTHNITLFQ
jgi:hypothetical protein